MPRPVILLILMAVFGGAGYALGEISKTTADQRKTGADNQNAIVFNAGQFTIPLFEDGRVPFFLLAEVNIEVRTYDEVSLLSANKPAVRAAVLETFFELERRGDIKPDTIKPEVIQKAIQEDLEATFAVDNISGILLNRLLIQEAGGRLQRS
ncbi:MAG: hypothetical protein V2I43_03330 [Parvularcula sp.]|nr:hypothetical protein [Parvularcula sp.]